MVQRKNWTSDDENNLDTLILNISALVKQNGFTQFQNASSV